MTAYEGVKALLKGQPDWEQVVKCCYEIAPEYRQFAGHYVFERVGWFPSLRTLVKYGILVKQGESTRGKSRAYYTMPDREGVGLALRELGML